MVLEKRQMGLANTKTGKPHLPGMIWKVYSQGCSTTLMASPLLVSPIPSLI